MRDDIVHCTSKIKQLIDDGELEPIDILIAFKEIVSPNNFANKDDLKKLICQYIDDNMIHSIY